MSLFGRYMEARTPAKEQESDSLLAEDEEQRLEWEGILNQGEEEEYPAIFVASDSRLIFSLGSGHFKDIGFNHIESVEVAADTQSETRGTDPDGIIAMGVISAFVGLGAMFMGGFSALATLTGLCLCGLGGYGIWYGKENYDRLKDELEVTEYTVYHILLRTNAESPFSRPIYIETRENVGPELSKLVQENQ